MFFRNYKTIYYLLLLYYLHSSQNCLLSLFRNQVSILQAIWSDLAALDCGPSSAVIVDVPPHAEKANFFGLSKTALLRHARARC